MRPDSAPVSGNPNPPASSPGVRPRGSSNSANGLPRVSAMIRSRTRSSRRPPTPAPSSPRASPSASPSTVISGRPSKCGSSLGSRTANTMAIRSASRRRATKASAWRGSSIEPLRIVDQAHERTLLRRVGEQAQDRERHEEVIRGTAVLEPERLAQRVPLRAGKPTQPVEHRAAELMHAGERELHLGLHAGGASDAPAGCPLDDVLQQRGLADARLAAHDQHLALTRPHASQQPIQRLALAASTKQSARTLAIGHCQRRAYESAHGHRKLAHWGTDWGLPRTRGARAVGDLRRLRQQQEGTS